MGFKYPLRLSDGDDAGEAELGYQPQAGDEIRINGNRLVRVRSVIPVALAAEFVDGAVYGVLEIESVGGSGASWSHHCSKVGSRHWLQHYSVGSRQRFTASALGPSSAVVVFTRSFVVLIVALLTVAPPVSLVVVVVLFVALVLAVFVVRSLLASVGPLSLAAETTKTL